MKLRHKINNFLLKIKKNQKIKLPQRDKVKINLGSGSRVVEGWINFDASLNAYFSKFPVIVLKIVYPFSANKTFYSKKEYIKKLKEINFIHYNLEYGLPLEKNSVDYIYSDNFIEHLFKEDAIKLLKDCYKVLKKRGIIRIVTPDLSKVVKNYRVNKRNFLETVFNLKRQEYFSYHKYLYDFEMLKEILEKIGFSEIKKCSHGKGKVPDIKKLDSSNPLNLYIEAIKK